MSILFQNQEHRLQAKWVPVQHRYMLPPQEYLRIQLIVNGESAHVCYIAYPLHQQV